jgi:hypothetical protein
MRLVLIALLLAATPAFGQVYSRPTDPPTVDASSESWFRLREPIQLEGDVYYPSGATVFFNGNVMVRTGHYNGIPVYADATVAAHGVLFVPAGRGLMQPYERPRRGALAGAVGNRFSGFPVRLVPESGDYFPQTATAPTQIPVNGNAVAAYTPDSPGPVLPYAQVVAVSVVSPPAAAPATAVADVDVPAFREPAIILSPYLPESNDGIWFRFANQRWVNAGRAERHTEAFNQVGTYAGFPVYRRDRGDMDLIYLPARNGMLTPYRRKS